MAAVTDPADAYERLDRALATLAPIGDDDAVAVAVDILTTRRAETAREIREMEGCE